MNGTCNVSLMQFKLLSHVDTEKKNRFILKVMQPDCHGGFSRIEN